MGVCEIVTEQENAGSRRTGRTRRSEAVRGLGEKCVLDPARGPALAARVEVVG